MKFLSVKNLTPFLLGLSIFPLISLGSLFIDHIEIETNSTLATVAIKYKHNDRNNCIVDVTIHSFYPALKGLIYIKVNVAENKDDTEFRRELIRTRIDMEKLLRGLHGNFLVKTLMKSMRQQIVAMNLTVPVRPVCLNLIKFSF